MRLIVTGGTDLDQPGTGSRTLVFAETLASLPAGLRLLPVVAPWHPDGAWSGLTGAKTLSYAPNMEARLAALRSGFDDALLIGRSGSVLEGPNSSIAWVRGDRLEYPDGSLGVLDSITLGCRGRAGAASRAPTHAPGVTRWTACSSAGEVVSLSTVREVMPVVAVGDRPFDPGPRTSGPAGGVRRPGGGRTAHRRSGVTATLPLLDAVDGLYERVVERPGLVAGRATSPSGQRSSAPPPRPGSSSGCCAGACGWPRSCRGTGWTRRPR